MRHHKSTQRLSKTSLTPTGNKYVSLVRHSSAWSSYRTFWSITATNWADVVAAANAQKKLPNLGRRPSQQKVWNFLWSTLSPKTRLMRSEERKFETVRRLQQSGDSPSHQRRHSQSLGASRLKSVHRNQLQIAKTKSKNTKTEKWDIAETDDLRIVKMSL